MSRFGRRTALAALGALTLGPACRRDSDRFAMVLSASHGRDAESVRALTSFMREQTSLAFEVIVAKDGEDALRIAGSANTHAGLLTLFEYLFTQRQFGAEAALRVVRKQGQLDHQGEILVRADSGHRALADLNGKPIAYVDRSSTTGFLLAAKKLADAKVKVTPSFAGSHARALDELRAGRVAAAAVYVGAAADDPDLSSLVRTERIPNEPVFFRADIAADRRRRVHAALLAFAATERGRFALARMADVTGFVPVTSESYAPAHAAIQAAGKTVKDLVPRGWLISNERERAPQDLAP